MEGVPVVAVHRIVPLRLSPRTTAPRTPHCSAARPSPAAAPHPAYACASASPLTPGTVTANTPPWLGDGALPCRQENAAARERECIGGSNPRGCGATSRGRCEAKLRAPSFVLCSHGTGGGLARRLRAGRDVENAQVAPACVAGTNAAPSARLGALGGPAPRTESERADLPHRQSPTQRSACPGGLHHGITAAAHAPKVHAVGRFTGSFTAHSSLPVSESY